MDNTWRFKTMKFRRSVSLLEICDIWKYMSPSSIKSPSKSKKQESPLNLKTVNLRNPNKNRSMDHNNLSIKAILMKYRSPFVASLFQKRPSCFPERCLLLDSQHVNENARVIRSLLPMMLCE